MSRLPVDFEKRMKEMLGEEYGAFLKSYERPPKKGLRVNTLKLSAEEFERLFPYRITKVPWVASGYFYEDEDTPSRHPYYAAGLYYLQEPSAMTPADRLPVQPGDRVLDMCAAPGGKATELAAKLKGKGILVANEISNSRAKALLRNLELFGAKNCFVTNEDPSGLSAVFPEYFDKILVDAPCSGEGMFHKQEAVIQTWSEERVAHFSNLQKSILEEAVKMLQPGGMLMYSTCTFSPDEDESVISSFLGKHPEMHLIPIEPYEGFRESDPAWGGGNEELKKCVRIWPHHMDGEGHFLALMEKDRKPGQSDALSDDLYVSSDMNRKKSFRSGERERKERDRRREGFMERSFRTGRRSGKKAGRKRGKNTEGSYRPDTGEKEGILLCTRFMEEAGINLDPGLLECRAGKIYLVNDLLPAVTGLHFLRNGVYVGDVKKNRFEPSQPFALTLDAAHCASCIDFAPDDPRLGEYMRGSTVVFEETADRKNAGTAETDKGASAYKSSGQDLEENHASEIKTKASMNNGWKLVCVNGYGIGWGKYVNGILKNKYPVSWRTN